LTIIPLTSPSEVWDVLVKVLCKLCIFPLNNTSLSHELSPFCLTCTQMQCLGLSIFGMCT